MNDFINIFKKFKSAFFIAFISISIFAFFPNKIDAALTDDDDVFEIEAPTNNEIVKDIFNVSWKLYDDDQEEIQYSARLFDAQTCSNTNLGSITKNSKAQSSKDENSIIQWNTSSTSTTSPLSDGKYCIKLCAALLNEQAPYSVCNTRVIGVYNSNTQPKITSNPDKTEFTQGETFSYQITVDDPDKDPIKYRFIKANAELRINEDTGEITSIPLSTHGQESISYDVTIAVTDNKSPSVFQSFTIKVRQDENSQSDDDEISIVIKFPLKTSVLSGNNALIRWELVNPDNVITKLSISYTKDTSEWTTIANDIGTDKTEQVWDVSDIEKGEYLIRIQGLDADNNVIFETVSDKFNISDEDNTDITSTPLIINPIPANNDVVDSGTPIKISGELVPSINSEIVVDSFEMIFDNEDVTSKCTVTAISFDCDLTDRTVPDGKHQVQVRVQDSTEKETSYDWVFIVGQSPGDQTTLNVFGREIPRSALILIIIICGLGFTILFVPWIIYLMWSGGSDEETVETKEQVIDQQSMTDYLNPYDPYTHTDPSAIDYNQQGTFVYQPETDWTQTYVPQGQTQSSSLAQNNQTSAEPNTTITPADQEPISYYEPEATS